MSLTPSTVAALVIAASFAAGLNVYATVMTLGILARAHWVALPPGLETLADGWVIGASGALFAAEFVADKIPGFDLLWNALHTFIRIPVAALLAYQTAAKLSPGLQLTAALAGAAIALAAHGSKTALRAIVTPSPEPVSNIALSLGEDAAAIGITGLAAIHPWVAAVIVLALLAVIVLTARWTVRILRKVGKRLQPTASPERSG